MKFRPTAQLGQVMALLERIGAPQGAILRNVALATDRRDALCDGIELLAPYSGHGIVNTGAATFHGVVADVLHRAADRLGNDRAASWLSTARDAYIRLGAT
ncbi:hypothetical protein ACQP0C_33155 [Nocardia sp. CA-129566]|uniref:hypothetical protein n=1 Tax=Nocardia sp. CA-129566 TaxID=3239976 RepID=UPI003D9739E1